MSKTVTANDIKTQKDYDNLLKTDATLVEGLEDRVRGYAPLNLDENQTLANLSSDEYVVDKLLGDILMVEYVDDLGDGMVNRGGIILKSEINSKMWRTGRVVKTGPIVPKEITEGTLIRFPSDKGLKGIFCGKKYVFLNAERVFCTVKQVSTK